MAHVRRYHRIPVKWKDWLAFSINEFSHLRSIQQVYKETLEIIHRNQKIQHPSAFYDFIRDGYVTILTTGLRRLIDPNRRRRSYSLRSLIEDIYANVHLLTRRRYIGLYKAKNSHTRQIANRHFDSLAGPDKQALSKRVIMPHLSVFRKEASVIKRYVDKNVAHSDKRKLRNLPTFADLDKAMDDIEEILKKFALILEARGWPTMTPVFQYNWKRIFQTAWLT